MMTKKVVFLLLAIFFVFSLVGSVCAASYTVELYQEDTKILVKETINLDMDREFKMILPSDFRSLSVQGEYTQEGNELVFNGRDFVVSYITNGLVDASGSNYYFSHKLFSPVSGIPMNVTLFLNEGFGVDPEDVFPKGSNLMTNGRSISLQWHFDALSEGEDIALFVKFEDLAGSSDWIIFGEIFIVFILGFFFFVYFWRRKVKNKIVKKIIKKRAVQDYTSYLIESEKTVVEELRKAEKNEIWQKQLQLATGFSKAKMSRVVRNLESRGIIEKITLGNTNKIKLKK